MEEKQSRIDGEKETSKITKTRMNSRSIREGSKPNTNEVAAGPLRSNPPKTYASEPGRPYK